MTSVSVEVIQRGIFHDNLTKNNGASGALAAPAPRLAAARAQQNQRFEETGKPGDSDAQHYG
jgi:hypothetical protein